MKNMPNNYLLKSCSLITTGLTNKKYVLTVDGYIPKMSRRKRMYHIKGEIYLVDTNILEKLDIHEGKDATYTRKRLIIDGDNGKQYCSYTYFNSSENGVEVAHGDYRLYTTFTV